ncbi:porphobilinogen deaminase, dipyromethane cofactor binding domain-containing protein [Neohortaea acidophila]|uniref:Porphobilinogen deaminase n=1 Tax=Neohortaea acidophila TaxID=245834 RepID=A0A6A6Q3T7_9PEZI|nr:porphobilinogen deaminase, dipyromethane cofactor binding domain-containing protein [Neohortaea acidophila]KAF2486323.1 porphobilinogen deaminase, dipyromethane cofactor binding domain-containing protein [Neohortaea acidophila]
MAAAPEPMQVDVSTSNHAATETQVFHIGTRSSILARVQADEVLKALRQAWPHHQFEIHAMNTAGDNNQKTALYKFNDKALWTQELEVLLQEGQLDFIVHSLKDMPTQLPHDLDLGCVTKRLDPRDGLVIKPSLKDKYHSLADLPEGSIVGTSSLRRTALMKKHYPHLKFTDVRGNIGTRLAKLDNPDSEYSAIVLAVCGLQRTGMENRVSMHLSKSNGGMHHAVGQGALGIETRKDDKRVLELLSRIECSKTTRQALAERSLMRILEGGCSVPIGVETEWVARSSYVAESSSVGVMPSDDYDKLTGVATAASQASRPQDEGAEPESSDEMIMRAIVVSLDGSETAEVETRKLVRNKVDAEQFGRDVAKALVEKGAAKILENIMLNRKIIDEQGQA